MIKLYGLAAMVLFGTCSATHAADEDLRDPTRPLSYTATRVDGPKLVLQAILKREAGPEAIVNGQRVQTGGTVDGVRVSRITDHSIIYFYQGQSHTVRLRPQIFTRQSP